MNNNNYKVYIHKNTINGKMYIGQTKQSLSRRFRGGDGYSHCPYFYAAIQKYGWDNFQHYIYKDGLSQEEANQIEQELIQKYHTQNPDFGYNIADGGNNFIPSQLISKNNIENWKNGIYDKIKNKVFCVELDRYFDSALDAERQIGVDNSAIQKVCKGKLNYTGIIDGKPLHWLFAADVSEDKIEELKNRYEIIKGRGIPLYCKELNEYFASAAEASKKYNIDASCIRKAAKNPNKSAGTHPVTHQKLHWQQLIQEV